MNAEYRHMLAKCRDAKRLGDQGPGPLSTGEKLAAALVLNRADWLAQLDYTIAEAIERVGPEWVQYIPSIARQLEDEGEGADYGP